MSNPIKQFFQDCEVVIKNSKTSENFDLFVKDVENSHFNMAINVVCGALLNKALQSGWNENEPPLSVFLAKECGDQESEKPDIAKEILDLFDEYGRIYLQDKETPFVLIKVKKTGEPVYLDDADLVKAIIRANEAMDN